MSRLDPLLKISVAFWLLLASASLAQQPNPLQGSWTASVGPTEIFRGMWAAETSPQNRNAARGSWTLLNDAGEVVLQGTFSAKKIGTAWTGTWTARAAKGTPLSGTWSADLPAFTGKTIQDMLQQATAKEAAGSWQTGRRQGHWWLKSLSAPPRR
ncbi:MAG TPA: hypothetical protein VIM00_04700 [Candidatus Acidoferrum sp.]|jgi:hypothetical protein